MKWLLAIFVFFYLDLEGITLSPKPISICYTPNSILKDPPLEKARYAGQNPRLATCSDVCWFPEGTHLAAVGLLNPTISVYRFESPTLQWIRTFSNQDGLNLDDPEKLMFSPDNKFIIALSHDNLKFFPVEGTSLTPSPVYSIGEVGDDLLHGAAFSLNGTYLAYVTADKLGKIRLYKKKNRQYKLIQSISNSMLPMKPKGILFSPDNRFVAICFSLNVDKKKCESSSLLAIYSFNLTQERIQEKPISTSSQSGGFEAIAFSPDCTEIYSTDQVYHRILKYPFDPKTGLLGSVETALENPEACLSFPHGLNFSPNGKFLAVSNYGDDKITLYQVEEEK